MQILELVRRQTFVSVSDANRIFGTSEVTTEATSARSRSRASFAGFEAAP